jgi:hypothetical protein
MLPAMKRLLFLAWMLASACGGSDSPTPTTPTQAAFPLPAGAPSDAAAPAGATRITITTIEIIGPDGVRVTSDTLKVTALVVGYKMRVWLFCPTGLEGPQGSGWNAETLEFTIRKTDPAITAGGTFSGRLKLDRDITCSRISCR